MSFSWSAKNMLYATILGLSVFLIHFALISSGVSTSMNTNVDFTDWGIVDLNISGYSSSPRNIESTRIGVSDFKLSRTRIDTEQLCNQFEGNWIERSNFWGFLPWIDSETVFICEGSLPLNILTLGQIPLNQSATNDRVSILNGHLYQNVYDDFLEEYNINTGNLPMQMPKTVDVCSMPWSSLSIENAEILGCSWNVVTEETDLSIPFGMGLWGSVWESFKQMINFNTVYGVIEPFNTLLNIFNTLISIWFLIAAFFMITDTVTMVIPLIGRGR